MVINELLAHTDAPEADFVELYNRSGQPVDISGCVLTDDFATNKFVVPAGTVLAPADHVAYTQAELGFGLSSLGETVYLKDPEATRALDAVRFGAQEHGVAFGRWPDGASEFYRLATPTMGSRNAEIRPSDVVINELMYDPLSRQDDDQYVELYNRSSQPVDLSGWQLGDTIRFTFPPQTILAPDGYLVVARDAARLRGRYAQLNARNCLGNYQGKLAHKGARVTLSKAAVTITVDRGVSVTNHVQITVNEVTYGCGGRWGQWSGGGGSSLELLDPRSNNRLAANWGDSDESQKAPWTTIEATGTLDHGFNFLPYIGFAQIGLLDTGECLVDDCEVRAGTNGPNLVLDPDFEDGLGAWSLQGDHGRSTVEAAGYAGGHALHLRATDRLWTGANSCQVPLLANSLAEGQTATLRFKARWLRGWPEVLFRLNGNWLEAAGPLPLPGDLGTPGARNSRYVSNAPPALYEVSHSPALPPAAQPVLVTARVHDPDGLQSLVLNYRLDPDPGYTALPMKDDGTEGDAVAADGLYSASLPPPPTNALAAFYLTATDARGASSRFPALLEDHRPVRECVVRWGDVEPGGSFGAYHLWLTQASLNRWSNLPDLSNELHDGTFVSGSRVIYNMSARFAGSPYHQNYDSPTGRLCHYKWVFPDDDLFLGETSFNKLHQPGNRPGDDLSLQREQLANTFLRALGVPWLNRRYVAVFVNGNRRGTLMEDAQTPDGDLVKQYFPDDAEGWLFKMQPWYEFGPYEVAGAMPFNDFFRPCTILPYTTTGGVKKTARYRYTFMVRRTPGSASDYRPIFSLVDAAGLYGSSNYVASLENMADMENWMRVFAANRAAGNWDFFGSQSDGGNLYGYLGQKATRYSLLMFDFNLCLGSYGSWGPGEGLFSPGGMDPNVDHIYLEPIFRRMYWRALEELIQGPLDLAVSGPLLDAKYHAFTANQLQVEDPNAQIKLYLEQARVSIARQLAAENTTNFTVTPDAQVTNNLAVVRGSAPVQVATVTFNGVPYPLTWTGVTQWTAALPLQEGAHVVTVLGLDRHGQPVPGASDQITLACAQPASSPVGQVVINEVMARPTIPGAEYVELYNTSTQLTWDLAGWQVRGLAYTFPPGAMLGPQGFLVLAANRAAYATAYGAARPLFDAFSGTLQPDGEPLALLQPGTNDDGEQVIARVDYASALPWPQFAEPGASLQLLDASRDNWRVANWLASPATPATSNAATAALAPFPTVWLNEVQTDNLTGPTNAAGQRAPWIELFNPGPDPVSLDGLSLATSYTNLAEWAFPSNLWLAPGRFLLLFADGRTDLTTAEELHTGFTLASRAGSLALSRRGPRPESPLQVLDFFNYTHLRPGYSFGSAPDGQSFVRQVLFYATPGEANDDTSPPVPVCINEWMAGNTRTIANPIGGNYGDWFELYNYGSNTVDLAGYYLTHSATNAFECQIPPGYAIPPGGFLLVWADKEDPTGAGDLHVNFKLNKGGTSIGLCGPDGRFIDFVSFGPQTSDISMGRFPDGGAGSCLMPGTPRLANQVNHPPCLAPIPEQRLTLNETLHLTLTADDTDRPAQNLRFSLASDAPAGLSLNPVTGALVWTPEAAPALARIQVWVTDDGVPSLSTTQTFTVLVRLPAPAPQVGFGWAEGAPTLSWPSVLGRTYRVEVTEDLSPASWVGVGEDQAGTGAPLSVTVAPTAARAFYRVVLLP